MDHIMPEMISNYPDASAREQQDYRVSKNDPMQQGQELRQSEGYQELPSQQLENGSLLLRARIVDSFNFVDHPQVELDPEGNMTGYRCDCPQGRMERTFCGHCAALLLGQQEGKAACSIPEAAVKNAPEDEEDWEEDEPEDEDADTEDAVWPEVKDFSYKFCNSAYDLYPMERSPRIPLERYIQVYGNNARARSLYNRKRGWGGSCFGFTATSALLHQPDGGVELSDFDRNAQIPSQVAMTARNPQLGMSLHSFIEAMQITQYGHGMWYDLTLDQLAEKVEDFQFGEGEPLSMGVQSKATSRDGHSVFPFRLERTDGHEDILHIYDPNYPLQVRYGYLEKDETGHYIHWRFPMNQRSTYGSRTGGILDHSPYGHFRQVWENRGGPNSKNLLLVRPGAAILDAAGKLLVRVGANSIETFDSDMEVLSVKAGQEEDPVLAVPAGTYRVALEDPDLEELEAQLIGLDLAVELSTRAREAELCVDEDAKRVFARVSTPESRYAVRILSTLDETEEETLLTGLTGAQELSLLQEYGKLYAGGLTEQAALYINREAQALDTIGQLMEEEEEEEEEEAVPICNSAADKPQEPQE